jgi:hypothetical protein
MTRDERTVHRENRRNFLQKALAVMTAGVAFTAARKAKADSATAEDASGGRESSGYRETEHVRAYYRSVRS